MFKKVRNLLKAAQEGREELEGTIDDMLALIAKTSSGSDGNKFGNCRGCWECKHAEGCKGR